MAKESFLGQRTYTSDTPSQPLSEKEFMLAQANLRNTLYPPLIEQGAYLPAQFTNRLIMYAIADTLVGQTHWEGQNNLKKAIEIAKDQPVTIISDHNSDFDHPVFGISLMRKGHFGTAQRLAYIGGTKMIERKSTRWFSRSEHVVYVGTPKDRQNLDNALASGTYNEEEYETLQTYDNNMRNLNKAASISLKQLAADGKVIRFYPQSERSREPNSQISRVPAEVSLHFMPDSYIIPILCNGAQKAVPVEGSNKYVPFNLDIIVGEPFHTREIKDKWKKIPRDEKDFTLADLAMHRLVSLNPVRIADNARDFYDHVGQVVRSVDKRIY